MTTWFRTLTVVALAGALGSAGPAPAVADVIGTLDWFECSGGELVFGDDSNASECGALTDSFSRFALTSFGIVDFLSASVDLTIDQTTTPFRFTPDPVGDFPTGEGPAGVETAVFLLDVAPGVVKNLRLPTLFRPRPPGPGAVVGLIEADVIVPEPTSATLLAAGVFAAGLRRRVVVFLRR